MAVPFFASTNWLPGLLIHPCNYILIRVAKGLESYVHFGRGVAHYRVYCDVPCTYTSSHFTCSMCIFPMEVFSSQQLRLEARLRHNVMAHEINYQGINNGAHEVGSHIRSGVVNAIVPLPV